MTRSDPIASPTLAQLYIKQGHLGHAHEVLAQVLDEDPRNGVALVLRDRLHHRAAGTLALEVERGELDIKWQHVRLRPNLHLVLMWTFRERDGSLHMRVTSVPCASQRGRHRVSTPAPHGSVVVSIGHVDSGGYVAEAVAEPMHW